MDNPFRKQYCIDTADEPMPTMSPLPEELPERIETVPRHPIVGLYNEIDCRIEHGAESGGHLEYVRQTLKVILEGCHV